MGKIGLSPLLIAKMSFFTVYSGNLLKHCKHWHCKVNCSGVDCLGILCTQISV